jgi:hypothetical protein
MQSRTIEEREQSYRDVLVESCKSSVQACPRVVFMSSISVYADGLQGDGDLIDETTPRSTSDEPSTVYYSLAEDAILSSPGGTVLRLADIYGHPRDIDFTARVRLAHEHMGGSVSFAGDGRLHRVHVEDVADAPNGEAEDQKPDEDGGDPGFGEDADGGEHEILPGPDNGRFSRGV